MNDLPIQKLSALTKHFGKDLLNDYARCDELLSDFCAEYRLEVSILVSALREGCVKDLLDNSVDGVLSNGTYDTLVGKIQHHGGIVVEYAEQAVSAIMVCLELKNDSPMLTAVNKLVVSTPIEAFKAVSRISLKLNQIKCHGDLAIGQIIVRENIPPFFCEVFRTSY